MRHSERELSAGQQWYCVRNCILGGFQERPSDWSSIIDIRSVFLPHIIVVGCEMTVVFVCSGGHIRYDASTCYAKVTSFSFTTWYQTVASLTPVCLSPRCMEL